MVRTSDLSPLSVGLLVAIDVYCRGFVGERPDEWIELIFRCYDPRVSQFVDIYESLAQFDPQNPRPFYAWIHGIWDINSVRDLSSFLRTARMYAGAVPETSFSLAFTLGKSSILGRWCSDLAQYYLGNQELSTLFEEFCNARTCTELASQSDAYREFAATAPPSLYRESQITISDAIERELAPEDPLTELQPAQTADESRLIEAKLQQNDTSGAIRAAHAKFCRLADAEHPYAMLKLAEISTQAGDFDQSTKYLLEAINLARRQGNDLLVVLATLSLYSLSIDFPEAVMDSVGDRSSLWSFLESSQNKQIFADNFAARLLLKQLDFQQSVLMAVPSRVVKAKMKECEEVLYQGNEDSLEAHVSYQSMLSFYHFMQADLSSVDVDLARIDALSAKRGLRTKMDMDLFVDKAMLLGFAMDRTEEALELVQSKRSLTIEDKSVAETWMLLRCILKAQNAVKIEDYGEAFARLQQCELLKRGPSAGVLASVQGIVKLRFLIAIGQAEMAYEQSIAKYREYIAKPTSHIAFALINLAGAIRALAEIAQDDISAYEKGAEYLSQLEELMSTHTQEIAMIQVQIAKVLLLKAARQYDEAIECSEKLIHSLCGTCWPYFLAEAHLIHANLIIDAMRDEWKVPPDAFSLAMKHAKYLLNVRFADCGFLAMQRRLDELEEETKNIFKFRSAAMYMDSN